MVNIETLIKKMIDIHVKDVDSYVNNDSLWLIFTEEKKWVIELEKDGILWYNYNFFSKIFKLISMNVVDNEHYITRWVEDAIQNGVKHTYHLKLRANLLVEDALQNGVKYTERMTSHQCRGVEDAIQNGVKHTLLSLDKEPLKVEDTIQNGVKDTISQYQHHHRGVENTLQNGVKHARDFVEGIIKDND